MLAVTTTDQLSLIDPQTLRRPPSSLPSCLSLLAPCAASAWSPDNLHLFLASADTIHQYNPALNTLTEIFSSSESITHLVSGSKLALGFATADKIHVLESTKVVQTFDSHKAPITSLSLLNEFLASTSAGAAHVHNLLLDSHIVLRGLNLAGQRITTCAFHPHSRAKLLLGVGKQLVVYDTTRPSAPQRTILLNDASTGDIVSVACSPFSKTLVAVASASGSVSLVDLDKEKGLFRTLNLKVPLTSATFSPSGESIYLGTENGKLLIMDLRALDKLPKAVFVSESGCRVQTMTVQKKAKGSAETETKATTAAKVSASGEVIARRSSTAAAPTGVPANKCSNSGEGTARRPSTTFAPTAAPVPKVGPSPSKARIARIGSGASPAGRPSTVSARSPKVATNANPTILSPVRDPRGNNPNIDDLSMQSRTRGPGKKDPATDEVKLSARVGARLLSSKDAESPSRLSAASRTRKTSITESGSARRAVTSAARIVSDSISAKSTRSGSGSLSRPSSSASQRSSAPPVPRLPAHVAARSTLPDSRTPSPDLPSVTGDPGTPLPISKKSVALGTPDAKRRLEADESRSKGRGKGKTVNFRDGNDENSPEDEMKERERERSLSMQISPRRPSSAGLAHSASWAPSPLRNAVPSSPAGGSSSAHDLLRTIVRDALLDFQQDQRSEMVGLHLDLLRMGRGWKRELRELMDEYVGDLRELREENKRLREENELLRRGY
ncbi:Protein NEDD1 [Mycena venus]|uniref:Protein NEDD1 n=1 Tax=Mycena venus TaxID=2733690 RepID=A0A8H6XC52_9AGAR|nr:Protein NEDD1 [Mycena venus]